MYQTVNGVTLYYNEYGSGDKYVLSSQMGFDSDEKGWPMDLADEGFHVFTIQIRGYGRSTMFLRIWAVNGTISGQMMYMHLHKARVLKNSFIQDSPMEQVSAGILH